MRFSVFDNLVIMHCLPLGTAAVYDFLLPPDVPSDGSNLPLFQPLLVMTGTPQTTVESTILEPTDEQSAKSFPSDTTAAEGTTVAGDETPIASDAAASSSIERAADKSKAVAPPATAMFLPPCHAVDIARHTIYR